jgi:hypothetical protein
MKLWLTRDRHCEMTWLWSCRPANKAGFFDKHRGANWTVCPRQLKKQFNISIKQGEIKRVEVTIKEINQ